VEDDFAAAFLLGCLTTDNFWREPTKRRSSRVTRRSKDAIAAATPETRRFLAR
jgi:hypothetical protein